MTPMKRVELGELPARLVEAIHRATFLFAYSLPERGRYVARHIRPDGGMEEIEYDAAIGRLLTLEERRRSLREERTTLPEQRVTVLSRQFLDEETAELKVILDVRDADGAQLVALTKQVYDPTPWDLSAVVNEELNRQRFPDEYAAWPRGEKVAHWAMAIHRFRRAHGESGWDENEIFTRELVRDLERVDPRVRELLTEILALVGHLEQTAPAEMIAAFTSRTGVMLPCRETSVVWEGTGDPMLPYFALVAGQPWMLGMNDFPAEPLYTLFIAGDEVESFSDWPSSWSRPQHPSVPHSERRPRERPVIFARTGNAEYPFAADVDEKRWLLRVNDFPGEPFFTLFIDEKEIESFNRDEIGRWWTLPRSITAGARAS